jgi:inner membrane protein
MAADLDFIPGLVLGQLNRYHHAQSHSLTCAVVAASIALLSTRDARLRWGLLVGLAYASHLALDLLTFDDSPPQGIPLFWPYSLKVFQCPVTLLPNVLHGNGMELSAHNMGVALREGALLVPPLLGTLLFWSRDRRKPSL